MTRYSFHKLCISFLALLLISACSGGGDSSFDLSGGGTVTQGIVVDPYIEGAVFQEIDPATGAVLQRQSSPSDEFGSFTFPEPLTPGSIVEMKISNRGLHGGVPYAGILRRLVTADDEYTVVVSPLTTLLANGVSPEELIGIFNDAGLTGLTISDLYADPMDGLPDMATGAIGQDLKRLQAAMAANAYMEVTGNFHAGINELNDNKNFEIFTTMLGAILNLLNPLEFENISATMSSDPDVASAPVLTDFIQAVLAQQYTIIALAREDMTKYGDFSPALVEQAVQNAQANSVAEVKYYYRQRVPPSTVHDGARLYHDNCAGCHEILAITEKPARTAADIQSAIDNNVGGMAFLSQLTEGEIAAIAEALQQASPPEPDPPNQPPNGIALYGNNCAGCHQPLGATSKPGRSRSQIQAAIDNDTGDMGFLSSLTPDEVQAIADVLPAPPAQNPNEAPNGNALYASECAGCHQPLDATGKPGRSAAQIQAAIDSNVGDMGFLSSLTPEEVQAIADVLPAPPAQNPNEAPNGITLYGNNCAGCHQPLNTSNKPGRSRSQIQAAINANVGGMGYLSSLTSAEVQAIADVLPAAPPVNPNQPPNGTVLYGNNCAGCHQPLNTSNKPGRSRSQIQAAINANVGGMGYLSSLTSAEVQAIADVLPAAPPVNPNQPPNGTVLYGNNCAGCHQPLNATNKPGRTRSQIQAAINANVGGMGYLSSLTAAEVQAIADVLPAAPPVNPNQPPNGTVLYGNNCAGCHQPLNATNKPGRTRSQIQAAINANVGGMGYLSSLTSEELQAIADVLPQGEDPGTDYSDCTLCHGQPPSGNTFPDTAGAHAAHTVLASVGTSCAICHLGAAHNDQVDLGFPSGFNAKSGPATDNLDGTCSSINCHGGRTTPDWWEGSIVVDTQCTACHSSGSSQYNSYSSGMHRKHVQDKGYSCTVCHNTSTLRNGHFINLESSGFEQSPAATIGGGSTRVGSYSNGTCSSIDCHGSERWSEGGGDND